MGEIMRWRLTRGPQRRVPPGRSTLVLGTGRKRTNAPTLTELNQLLQGPNAAPPHQVHLKHKKPVKALKTVSPYVAYLSVLTDITALRAYLTTGVPPDVPLAITQDQERVAAALMQLDEWLAANAPVPPAAPPFGTPDVGNLNQQTTTLLGQYLPHSATWNELNQTISNLLYAGLVLSAMGLNGQVIDALGLLVRYLLIIGLVDDLQVAHSPIATPDDVYAALRWRTIVLPDAVVALLLSIRASHNAVLVRKPGFADLFVTREEWDHYEAAEIASIENILAGELKSRVHLLINESKSTVTTDKTTDTLTEQDNTTTDISQLQQQSSSDISIAAHVDGQVDVSAQWGTAQINSHVGGSLDYSNTTSTSRASTQSHETVARAVTKMEQVTREIRTVSSLTRSSDKEKHTFDNKGQQAPVVGIYRWVDQVQNVELDRYPHRFLMEFEIPEPGAWTRWLQAKTADRGMIHQLPVPLTQDGTPISDNNRLLQASDLSTDPADPYYFGKFTARYAAQGISPPPGMITIAANLEFPQAGTTISEYNIYKSLTNLSIPNGYFAWSWRASFLANTRIGNIVVAGAAGQNPPAVSLWVAVGAGDPVQAALNGQGTLSGTLSGNVGPISMASIPVSLVGYSLISLEVNVEITCRPMYQPTTEQWQNDTYDAIVGAYYAMLQAYNDEKAGLSVLQTNPVDSHSQAQNAMTIKQELKRQVIEMLIGVPFAGFDAINWDLSLANPPLNTANQNKLPMAAQIAPEIQFLEQAFEWETLTYICYPYYWTDSHRWQDLAIIQGTDSNFADFLRAGSARVVLAARPGFEDQVNFYVKFGILWGGGPVPAPGDPEYLSIADEIKAMQQRPVDVTVIDTWQVRLPTTLIWLENPNGLPKNLNPTIDAVPNIANLSPTAAAVSDSITVFGRNFGDVAGSSRVEFNGTPATPTRWSATSIDVAVPIGAASGDIVVTVNGVASNGAPFTVQ